jgi:segregation and condensation protein B
MELDAYIEAILFLEGEPVKIKKLAEILDRKEKEINEALEILEQKLKDRGVRLIKKDNEAMLSTAPDASKICETISKEEFNKDIGKAGLEILATVVYRHPISRSEIDYLRGVNSSFSLRNLLVRGLVERKTNPKDNRSYLYSPSFQFLQFLGVGDINKLPEYESFKKSIEQFLAESKQVAE